LGAIWAITHRVDITRVLGEELDLCNSSGLRYYHLENELVIPMLCDYPLIKNSTVWVKASYYGIGTYTSKYLARSDVYFYCSMSLLVSGFLSVLAVQKYVKGGEEKNLVSNYGACSMRVY
jgi:hypothetical protein